MKYIFILFFKSFPEKYFHRGSFACRISNPYANPIYANWVRSSVGVLIANLNVGSLTPVTKLVGRFINPAH